MKKILLVTFVFLAILPFCFSSYEKVIYNNWVLAGTPFKIDNLTYRINYIKESNSTVIYFPEGITGVIDASSSKCTKEGIYSVCQTKQKFERNGVLVPPDIHNPNINISLFLQINKSDVKLKVVENIPQALVLGDTAEIVLILENSAPVDITNIYFLKSFPNTFLLRGSGCSVKDNTISWQGNLQTESNFSCTYYASPKKEGFFEIKTLLSYVALEKIVIEQKNTSVLVEEFPFRLNYTTSPLNITVFAKYDFIILSLSGINNKTLSLKRGVATSFLADEKIEKTILEYSYKGSIKQAVFYFEKKNTSSVPVQNKTKKEENLSTLVPKIKKEENKTPVWVFYIFGGVIFGAAFALFLAKRPKKHNLMLKLKK
jgi:hypothetical protein